MTGGASRGRGRGISTVFVERGEGLDAAETPSGRAPRTGEIRTVPTRTGEVRVPRKGDRS
jgi:hypothetical protein